MDAEPPQHKILKNLLNESNNQNTASNGTVHNAIPSLYNLCLTNSAQVLQDKLVQCLKSFGTLNPDDCGMIAALRKYQPFQHLRQYVMNNIVLSTAEDLLALYGKESESKQYYYVSYISHCALPLLFMTGMKSIVQFGFFQTSAFKWSLYHCDWAFSNAKNSCVLDLMIDYGQHVTELKLKGFSFRDTGLLQEALEKMPHLDILNLHVLDQYDHTSTDTDKERTENSVILLKTIGCICNKLKVFHYSYSYAVFNVNAFLYFDYPTNSILNNCCSTLEDVQIYYNREDFKIFVPFIQKCPNLYALCTEKCSFPILQAYAQQQSALNIQPITALKVLRCENLNYNDSLALIRMCPNLCNMILLCVSTDFIKALSKRNETQVILSLNIRVTFIDRVIDVLKVCGNNLQDLTLDCIQSRKGYMDLSVIAKLCPLLKKLHYTGEMRYRKNRSFHSLKILHLVLIGTSPPKQHLELFFINIPNTEEMCLELPIVQILRTVNNAAEKIVFHKMKKLYLPHGFSFIAKELIASCPNVQLVHTADPTFKKI